MKPPRVLLADDHALVRAGFSSLLEKLGVQVVGEARDGLELLRLLPVLKPDLVLMDIAMPELNGLETTLRITQEHPGVRVIILSMHATAEYARRAIRAGAAGYLLKDASAAELDLALQAVARGETFLSPRVAKLVVADYASHLPATPLDKLTRRQREILQLIAEGHSRKEIAARLSISVKTFDTYRAQLMEQLDIHDVPGLVRFAANAGLSSANE
ncbi:MAG: response regulator transcription factor [Anaerolineae bacterium]|nr:response regulator transcription factor [Anaerolineae bacterium]